MAIPYQSNNKRRHRPVIFLWENFGPMHIDRCDAVARHLGADRPVIGFELFDKSIVYDWNQGSGQLFTKWTLFSRDAKPAFWKRLCKLIGTSLRVGRGDYFLCHYERPETLFFAWWLRLIGSHAYLMGCSKFDDYRRIIGREMLKTFFVLPYRGGISAGTRGRDYMRFLGLREDRVLGEYNTLSLDRIRKASGTVPAPEGAGFEERDFICIARFVPKKNLIMLLKAFTRYRASVPRPRRLRLCGAGVQETALREFVSAHQLGDDVEFKGFIQSDAISRELGTSLCLLLPSIEEQFGNVVIEAQAMGLPVILSENCGARDRLVRSGVNGFVVEADNIEGLAYFMALLSEDEKLWRRMCESTGKFSAIGDTLQFAHAVENLISIGSGKSKTPFLKKEYG